LNAAVDSVKYDVWSEVQDGLCELQVVRIDILNRDHLVATTELPAPPPNSAKSEQDQVDATVNSPGGPAAATDLEKSIATNAGALAAMVEGAKKGQITGIGGFLKGVIPASLYAKPLVLSAFDQYLKGVMPASLYAKQSADLAASIERLGKMPALDLNYKMPSIDPLLSRPQPRVQHPEVALLRQVHAELVGLAKLISETGKQTTAIVEVTSGNLTALQAMLAEMQASRKSADRSSSAVIWLTVALFVAAGVAGVLALTWTNSARIRRRLHADTMRLGGGLAR
jgi:hypothetical protein